MMGEENRCVCCGETIPEGTQVCPSCMRRYGIGKPEDGWRLKRAMRFERIMMDWVYPILFIIAIIAFILIIRHY